MSLQRTILFTLAMLGFIQAIFPQTGSFRFHHLGVEEGLSQASIGCMLQDRKGFMWFGTEDGLCKYDGYDFTIYRHIAGDTSTLSSNNISTIMEDIKGNIWVGTGSHGWNRFDPETELFRRYNDIPGLTPTRNQNDVKVLFQDSCGRIWTQIRDLYGVGIFRCDEELSDCVHINNVQRKPSAFVEDQQGRIWVGTQRGLFYIDLDSSKLDSLAFDSPDSEALSKESIYTLSMDHTGQLWVGTSKGLYLVSPSTMEVKKIPVMSGGSHQPDSIEIWCISEDFSGNIWIGGGDGLKLYNVETKQAAHFHSQPLTGIDFSRIISMYVDKSDLLWIGTFQGVFKLNLHRPFYHFQADPAKPYGLNHKRIRSFTENKEDGTIWIGTEGGGLNRLDPETQRITHPQNSNLPGTPTRIWSLFDDGDHLWMGTRRRGMYRYDKDKTITRMDQVRGGISFLQENENSLWIGNGIHGLSHYDLLSDQSIYQYKNRKETPQSITGNEIRALIKDSSGVIWIGIFGGGLNKLIPSTDPQTPATFQSYKYNPENKNSLSHNKITSIHIDSVGMLWIGTYGGGLNRYDPQTESFTHYGDSAGLPNEVVYGILGDEHDFLWMSTNKGISRFDPQTESFWNFDYDDGLQSNEFNSGSFLKSSTGKMYFGGINGFNVFHPDSVKQNTFVPPVVLTSFRLFNKVISPGPGSILRKSITYTDTICLSYEQDVFSFEFSALDFSNSSKNRYRYQMEGVDPKWVEVGYKRRFATYTKLRPGTYVFRVQAANNDGVWNETGTKVMVMIGPPWYWWNTWAYLLWGLLLLTLAFGLFQFGLNRIRLQEEQRETERMRTLDQKKREFFTHVAHELRTPLSLISGGIEQIKETFFENQENHPFQMVSKQVLEFEQRIEELEDLSKLDAGSLQMYACHGDMVKFVEGVFDWFEPLFQKKAIQSVLKIKEEEIWMDFDPDKMKKILANLLINAYKFTNEGGMIVGKLDKVDWGETKEIHLSIEDTGIGMSIQQQAHIFDRFYQVQPSSTRKSGGMGIGLSLTKTLVEAHNGQITVESKPQKGSSFHLSFHIRKGNHSKYEEDAFYNVPRYNAPADLTFTPPENAPTVLVVEDRDELRSFLCRVLAASFHTLEARDGEEGLQIAAQEYPDLVITDIMMPPGMDGYQLCEQLKEGVDTCHIPVILLTAKADKQSLMQGYEVEADDYFTKPFHPGELKVRMMNLLRQRERLRELYQQIYAFGPERIEISELGQELLNKINSLLRKKIGPTPYGVEQLSQNLGMSKATLNRKCKEYKYKRTPSMLIHDFRMETARELLHDLSKSIEEVGEMVGYGDSKNFYKPFKAYWSMTPGDYRDSL